ncbi:MULTISPECIES: hypothetical protein [unclassified Streptomyces]|uniref:hypothetical protein n=1 Tax=unclassified Streptomyces TaxID=2593676 RepID=UPI00081E375F|nr:MULTISPECIES: hypothetical protein [unclassified Streptomyces]MYZ34175.1 hypothetical protein [Streptomyces sp. SID4917]SCF64751.1 hypothetical protein GA0115259_100622 [Streptomyces sp. MnatMP-M17]
MARPWLSVLAQVAPVPLGLLLSGALVWGATNADWSGTTSNSGNKWTSSALGLANDSKVPMFRVDDMHPGDTGSNCIKIVSNADFPTVLKLYSNSPNWPSDFQSFINLKIEVGSGGTSGNCNGFTPHRSAFDGTLDQLVALNTDFRTGLGPWTLPGKPPNSLSFRVAWQFSPSAPDSAQSTDTNEASFIWEAREHE